LSEFSNDNDAWSEHVYAIFAGLREKGQEPRLLYMGARQVMDWPRAREREITNLSTHIQMNAPFYPPPLRERLGGAGGWRWPKVLPYLRSRRGNMFGAERPCNPRIS
jgi:hypothetical protein